jgi:MATE family multidrug resistance protein
MSLAAAARRELRPTVALAVPMIVGQVSQMLMGVTDSAMIGHAGTVPLAASAFAGNIFNIFYVMGIGLMVPVAVFVARARGAGSRDEAGEYLRHGCLLAVGFGLTEMLLMGAVATQLHRFGQPPEVVAAVGPYFLLCAASIVPVLLQLTLRQFAEAMGHPWVPMVITLGAVALNVLLNWILIYGHWGAPAWGLTGAGVATLVARVCALTALWLWIARHPGFRAIRGPAATIRASPVRRAWSARRLREMLGVGLPAAGMLLFEATAFSVSGLMVGWLGAVPLAAHQIAITCASLTFMVPLGLSMAAGMRLSHAVGAGERDRFRPLGLGALGAGLACMLGFMTLFWLAGRPLAAAFSADPAVIGLATGLLAVAAVFQLADGVQVISAALLRSLLDVRVPVAITLVAYWGLALPLGYGLGIFGPWGAAGIWTGIAGGLGFAAVFLPLRFLRLTRSR